MNETGQVHWVHLGLDSFVAGERVEENFFLVLLDLNSGPHVC
jgi:hypothetical protein